MQAREVARCECATLARFCERVSESDGGESKWAIEFDGADSNNRTLEFDGARDQFDHWQRDFWLAISGIGARWSFSAHCVFRRRRRNGGHRGVPGRSRLAISRDRWSLSLRA